MRIRVSSGAHRLRTHNSSRWRSVRILAPVTKPIHKVTGKPRTPCANAGQNATHLDKTTSASVTSKSNFARHLPRHHACQRDKTVPFWHFAAIFRNRVKMEPPLPSRLTCPPPETSWTKSHAACPLPSFTPVPAFLRSWSPNVCPIRAHPRIPRLLARLGASAPRRFK
jgi:hypothetical protein